MRFLASEHSSCRCYGCTGLGSVGRFEYVGGDDDYGDAEDSERGTSQNGWPASSFPAEIGIVTVSIPLRSGSKSLQVAKKAADALVEMTRWWDSNIEPVTSLGGYNYRNIVGYSDTISNHGSGTAIDINATKHPLGAEGTVSKSQAAKISAKAASLGLIWGGNYRNRKDEMHFEVAKNSATAIASAALGSAQTSSRSPLFWIVTVGGLGWIGYRELKKRGKIR